MEIGSFSASLVFELAKVAKAIYPGPVNQKHLRLLDEPIERQIFVHGSYGRGYCRIMSNDKAVVVAFRGTREDVDWRISNFRAFPVPLRDCDLKWPIFVHRGFQSPLDYSDKSTGQRSFDAILERLDAIEFGDRDLYITGHSLGGAIAAIFATKLRFNRPALVRKHLKGIVTFGAPSSGLAGFSRYYTDLHSITLRVINACDAVPFSPPALYRHVGSAVWLLSSGAHPDPGWKQRLALSFHFATKKSFVTDHSMAEYISAISRYMGVDNVQTVSAKKSDSERETEISCLPPTDEEALAKANVSLSTRDSTN